MIVLPVLHPSEEAAYLQDREVALTSSLVSALPERYFTLRKSWLFRDSYRQGIYPLPLPNTAHLSKTSVPDEQVSPPTKVPRWHQHLEDNIAARGGLGETTWKGNECWTGKDSRSYYSWSSHMMPGLLLQWAWQKEGWTLDMHEKCPLRWLWTPGVTDIQKRLYWVLAYLNHR